MIGANQAVWPQLKANCTPFPSTSACTNLVAGAPVAAARPQQPTLPPLPGPVPVPPPVTYQWASKQARLYGSTTSKGRAGP